VESSPRHHISVVFLSLGSNYAYVDMRCATIQLRAASLAFCVPFLLMFLTEKPDGMGAMLLDLSGCLFPTCESSGEMIVGEIFGTRKASVRPSFVALAVSTGNLCPSFTSD